MFSSLDCPELSTSTYLQVPPTHLVLSLRSFTSIGRQYVASGDPGGGFDLQITLCPRSSALFSTLSDQVTQLYWCAEDLSFRVGTGGTSPVAVTTSHLVPDNEEEPEF
ncbi:hypothetical protein BKA70DRAFT_1434896 [Coprinopsis sp. MPI-PUGE-AT-0042]|nr:hypothetical protein BKA70DRAFT_1434896 [Coprinopsis sp. MPI-PUGE-AT-0042]